MLTPRKGCGSLSLHRDFTQENNEELKNNFNFSYICKRNMVFEYFKVTEIRIILKRKFKCGQEKNITEMQMHAEKEQRMGSV